MDDCLRMNFPDYAAAAARFQALPFAARTGNHRDALILAVNRVMRHRWTPRTAPSRSKRAVNGRRETAGPRAAHALARREVRELVRRLRGTHDCPRCGHIYDGATAERHVALAGIEGPGGRLGEIRRIDR